MTLIDRSFSGYFYLSQEYLTIGVSDLNSPIERRIQRCIHGDDALDFLHIREKYAANDAKRPTVVLLDLNLPGTAGREVLEEIKTNAALRSIPVVILSTSSHPIDIETSCSNGANSYIVKPVDFPSFVHPMQSFDDYWFFLSYRN